MFLSIIWCKFQEFKLHRFREIEFFLGGLFFYAAPCRSVNACVMREVVLLGQCMMILVIIMNTRLSADVENWAE